MRSASALAVFAPPAVAALALAALAAPVPAALLAAGPCRAADAASPADADALGEGRRRLRDALDASAAAEARRRAEEAGLDAVRADRARLAALLIDATAHVRAAEERAAAAAARLDALAGEEAGLRGSLVARRAEIAEVLAALQRLGLHPPPALLASPDDAVRAVRGSILLGAAVPGLRAAAGRLAADLAGLERLRSAIADERRALAAEAASLGADRARLADLVAVRQAAQAESEGALDADRRRAAALASQAGTLKDLVAGLEASAAAARDAEEARRRAAEADAAGVAAKAAAATRDPARLAPATAFGEMKGRLALPATGRPIRTFGAVDSYGGQERGLSLATPPGAVVTAPADGAVLFAGPYRSYGRLLIVDVGDGYQVVMSGLARADVAPGQFVLAGEPLGAMGDGTVKTATAIALGAGEPVLYVEFRKDGAAIDPAPWWAKADSQKVRG